MEPYAAWPTFWGLCHQNGMIGGKTGASTWTMEAIRLMVENPF